VAKTGGKTKYHFGLVLALVLVASLLLVRPTQAQTEPEVSVVQTADPRPATVGQPYTFTITVMNNSNPQLVGLKDFLPSGMEFVSATPSQGTCGMSHHGNGADCTLGELPTGGSATVALVAIPTVPGTMTNAAVGEAELTPAGSDEATITVDPAPESGTSERQEGHY
jgi:uncharacterized repeat protein (TIGR01451 family)